ncbi:DUF6527 family protein [Massilia orientalis]|uniref:DUF6527 family protein n=1 Tax=Massilia orientalis TaxID=3050128 RepID=A0ACC7MQW0_9BURK
MRSERFKHQVVDSIPERLQVGTLYVTTDRDVAGHLCACGCGREVITPLSPTDWSITIDQHRATLDPSIGNWAFPCRSHYFIWDGEVIWAGNMSNKAIAQGRQRNKACKLSYYRQLNETPPMPQEHLRKPLPPLRRTRIQRLVAWWKRLFAR